MGLDIGVGDIALQSPQPTEPWLSLLDDEGYYWFLCPLFCELEDETGKMIDLYGSALFVGEELTALEQMLAKARHLVLQQPVSWKVAIGIRESGPVMRVVRRSTFLTLLERWESVVARARELKRGVVCFGD